jgi:glucose/mannose-6-phosphate isomerase
MSPMPLDSQNMLKSIKDFPIQCREALSLPKGISVGEDVSNIVVVGMGGSAIGGDLLKTYLRDLKIPITVIRDYKVPNFVNESTLVFAISYSGNTEETLSAYNDASSKGAQIISITSGGKLQNESSKVITIPTGLQPRAALGYLFFPMLGVLHNSNIARVKNEELNEMLMLLKKVEDFEEKGRELAKKLKDKIPVIYSSEALSPIAMRWKTQINENSKLPAFYNIFSEMNHNEIVGYKGMDRTFAAVIIRDDYDNDRIKKRMDISKSLMEQYVDVEEVETIGKGLLSRLFSAIYIGDFTSYHLALWNHVNPSPVEIIEDLKRQLTE